MSVPRDVCRIQGFRETTYALVHNAPYSTSSVRSCILICMVVIGTLPTGCIRGYH